MTIRQKTIKMILLFCIGFFLVSFFGIHPVYAIDQSVVLITSQVNDKVHEISGTSFYAYGGSCGTGGCSILEPTAPTGWKLAAFTDSSWGSARDAYEANPSPTEGAPHWWCSLSGIDYPNNCYPFSSNHTYSSGDPLQITGPSGFQNKETLLFRKPFTLNPPAGYKNKSIQLDLWSDNNSWAYIDGSFLSSAGLTNSTTASTVLPYTVTSFTIQASALGVDPTQTVTKELAIQVSNDDQGAGNPIGLSYRLTAIYEPIPPTGDISMTSPINCPGGSSCDTPPGVAYTLLANGADSGSHLNKIQIYASRVDKASWTTACPSSIYGNWCLLQSRDVSPAASTGNLTSSWIPPAAGDYYIIVIAYNSLGKICSGNPFSDSTLPGCGPGDRITLHVKPVNCANLSGPAQIILGQSGSYTANVISDGTAVNGSIQVYNSDSPPPYDDPAITNLTTSSGPISYTWTPVAAGTYTVICRAIKPQVIECKGDSRYVSALQYLCPGPATTKTVTVVALPRITSLQIGNTAARSFSGTYGISGNQSTQGGSNWLNPLLITLNINAGSSTSPQSYVAFYSRSAEFTDRATVIADIKNYLKTAGNKDKGFLLAYGKGINGNTENKHYVYDPNLNEWIELYSTNDILICNGTCNANYSNKLYYVRIGSNGARSWQVTFDQNLGYKTFYTMGYLVDGVSDNLYDFQPNASPNPGPL